MSVVTHKICTRRNNPLQIFVRCVHRIQRMSKWLELIGHLKKLIGHVISWIIKMIGSNGPPMAGLIGQCSDLVEMVIVLWSTCICHVNIPFFPCIIANMCTCHYCSVNSMKSIFIHHKLHYILLL